MGFNQAQMTAVSHREGPMMVLAGPGSGKTLVITHRTQALIEEYGVSPSNILVITFTKAAAHEMQSRFFKLTKEAGYPVSFGTFHAVFFKILKLAYHLTADNILHEEGKQEYLKEIISGMNLDFEDEGEFLSGIISEISGVKGDMIDLAHYYSKNCSEENFRKIYLAYERRLESEGKLDFDDMLVKCYELFLARPDILKMWQQKYQYILIDEFQDINQIQYQVVKMLAAPQNNLFIVGDDDQSIYRFRGARPDIMLNFEKDYPGTKKVLLNLNYRSCGEIVAAARRVIGNNKKRFDKEIRTENEKGVSPVVKECKNEEEQMTFALNQIRSHIESGGKYQDLAFLYRTNVGPRLLVEKLMEYNIPFHIKDALPNIYTHWIARDILAYIHLAMGSRDRSDYLRIINKPARYISREALRTKELNLNALRAFYQGKDWMWERIDKLEYDLGFMKKMTPFAAISYIRKGVGYDEYLVSYASFRRMKVEELYEILDELSEAAKPYADYDSWFLHIEEYGKKLKTQTGQKKELSDSIEIATMHGSKGLEYHTVFIPDANETVMPHQKATLPEDIEEERRLFYVAVTRAKKRLFVSYVKEKYNKPMSASRFVGELLTSTEELKPGTAVVHKRYGEGEIRKIEDGKMGIYFAKLGKELVFDVKFAVANQLVSIKKL